MKQKVHAIILTLNEELHIERCIQSIKPHVASILVVDSFSKDHTCEIAKASGARVEQKAWVNYATQFNFGVDLLGDAGGWLMRIDADEVLSRCDLDSLLQTATPDVDGFFIQRRIHFMGRRIRFGGIEPSWQLRIWRNGAGRCEQRWMDEHVIVKGKVQKSDIVFADINLNSLQWWTNKHNDYASREAIDILNRKHAFLGDGQFNSKPSGFQPRVKRFVKNQIYLALPSGLRAMLYFFYRYILRFGFLDGKQGAYFHILQGLWYRTLVDAKVAEIEDHVQTTGVDIIKAIEDKTGRNPIF